MKPFLLGLCVLGLTVGANGVEIRMGSAVLTADEAEYSLKTVATDVPTDVQLRGNVRLNGTVELARAIIR